jgi:LTXXQ motif family protein
MRKIATHVAVAAVLAAPIMVPTTVLLAQMGFPMGPGGTMPGASPGGIGCSAPDSLKSWLGITDVQKAVWDAYAAALKSNLPGLQGMRESVMTALSGKTSLEQLDAHTLAAENRLKALRELKPSLTALYSALSAEQKKRADQMLAVCMM